MAEERPVDDDLESFAAALSGLTPKSTGIDRERVIQELGKSRDSIELSVMRSRLQRWRFATALSCVTSLIFAILLFMDRLNRSISVNDQPGTITARLNRSGIESDHAQTSQGVDLSSTTETKGHVYNVSYIDVRNRALAEGVDTLAMPEFVGAKRQMTEPIDVDPRRFGG